MVLIQRSTQKVVVIHEPSQDYWFFPRGRKDLGESLETAALREAYEESGYRPEFMPIYNPSRAPAPPGREDLYSKPNTEPFYVTALAWKETNPQFTNGPEANLGYQYLTSWYIGQITDGAVPERGTGVSADEVNYMSHLLTYDEAMKRVWGAEQDVLKFAWSVFQRTLEIEAALGGQDEHNRHEKFPEATSVFRQDHALNLGVWEVQAASVE